MTRLQILRRWTKLQKWAARAPKGEKNFRQAVLCRHVIKMLKGAG